MDANHMVLHWQSSSNWQKITTISDVQRYANLGRFVVAGWINPTGDSGHVVVIVPGTDVYSKSWHCKVPVAMDCGGGKRSASLLLKWSFGTDKMDGVVYYMYK